MVMCCGSIRRHVDHACVKYIEDENFIRVELKGRSIPGLLTEQSTAILHKLKESSKVQIHLTIDGKYRSDNGQDKGAICALMEAHPCTHLELYGFSSIFHVDNMIKEVIMNACGKCRHLEMTGKFLENVMFFVHDFLNQNGKLDTLILTYPDLLNNGWMLLIDMVKLGSGTDEAKIELKGWQGPIFPEERMAGIVTNLLGFKHVQFRTSLETRPNTWRALVQLLNSSNCEVSELDLAYDPHEGLNHMMEGITLNSSIKSLRLAINQLNESVLSEENLQKFTKLESILVYLPASSVTEYSIDTLKSLLAKNSGNVLLACKLKSIWLKNYAFQELSEEDENYIFRYISQVFTNVVEVCSDSANSWKLDYQCRMNARWTRTLSTNSSIYLPLFPVLFTNARMEHEYCANHKWYTTREQYRRGVDASIASIRYLLVKQIVNDNAFHFQTHDDDDCNKSPPPSKIRRIA